MIFYAPYTDIGLLIQIDQAKLLKFEKVIFYAPYTDIGLKLKVNTKVFLLLSIGAHDLDMIILARGGVGVGGAVVLIRVSSDHLGSVL